MNYRKIYTVLTVLLAALAVGGCAPAATPNTLPSTARTPSAVAAATPTTSASQATAAPQSTATTAASVTPAPSATAAAPRELVLMSHDSFAASKEVIAAFEQANNVTLKVLKSGDAGAALNTAILAKGNPLADAFFGVDNTFLSRAVKAGIFEPYKPADADKIPAQYVLDGQYTLTPVDYGDVCLNYDRAYFSGKKIAPPATLDDLIKPAYKNLTVVENPATSSPGLAFLLATIGHFGEDKYLPYWKSLRANGVLVSDGWEDAYYAKSTWGGKGGNRPIVVSYATSPAAEVFFSDGKLKEPPTGSVLGDSACFRQVEFVGVLKGAKNPDLARKLVDFLVGQKFQEDVPAQMFVFPVRNGAALPDFYKFAETPQKPAVVGADAIDANREKWIRAWTDTVLR